MFKELYFALMIRLYALRGHGWVVIVARSVTYEWTVTANIFVPPLDVV